VRFGVVPADAGRGGGAEFRRGLDERGPAWAVGIPRNQEVRGADVRPVPPGGRKRRPVPDQGPREAGAALAGLPWRRATWRHGTEGPPAARSAATRIGVGDGAARANNRHLPGEGGRLVGERRAGGGRKHRLGDPAGPRHVAPRARRGHRGALGVRAGAPAAQAGTGTGAHSEGRSWTGLHRHALMACVAFACRRGRGESAEPGPGAAAIAEPAGGAPRHRGAPVGRPRRPDPVPAPQAQVQATA
jgi:hypothetical protein